MLPLPAVLLASVLIGAAPAPSGAAGEQTTCTYDNPSKTVTITVPNSGELEFLVLTAEGGVITFQEVNLQTFELGPKQPCGSATTSNTDLIRTQGGGPGGTLLAAEENFGPFAPGFTKEATGVSEIEFEFQLVDGLIIYGGSPAPAVVRLGTLGANINGDDDVDVTLGPSARFGAFGGPASDDIAATGGFGTGDAATMEFFAQGGGGSDRLAAGPGRATLNGLGGNDVLVGGTAGDLLTGDAGKDRVSGGPGSDDLQGRGGNDVVRGGPSRDHLDGGGGRDKCVGGPGKDSIRKCER